MLPPAVGDAAAARTGSYQRVLEHKRPRCLAAAAVLEVVAGAACPDVVVERHVFQRGLRRRQEQPTPMGLG